MRLRPKGYFERFQASIHRIYECLSRRIVNGRYDTELSRSRQRHWMLALQRQVTAFWEKASGAVCWRALSSDATRAGCRLPGASNLP